MQKAPDNHPGRDGHLAALILVLVGIAAYGPLMGQLGFYRDDWYQLWALDTFGPSSIITLFSIDRPVMGYLYTATSSTLGLTPLAWHVYSLALRLLGAVAFLALVRRLWPRETRATFLASLLFLVYPGFLHQPNADTFSNHLFTYTMAMISIWLTAVSLQASTAALRRLWTVLAVIAAAAYFPIYEYMIGLEGLRIGVLWLHQLRQEGIPFRQRIRRMTVAWSPYALAIAVFVVWRIFIFKSTRGATNIDVLASSYLANPRHALARLLLEGPKDLLEASILGWFVPTYNALVSAEYRQVLTGLAWALAAVIFTVGFLWLTGKRLPEGEALAQEGLWSKEALWLGALGTVSTVLTVLLAGRDIRWDSGFDRYTLQTTAGLALLVIGFLWRFVRPPARLSIPILLVGLSVLTHYLNAAEWRDFWSNQQSFWWQMSWRAPQLEDGTVLVIEVPGGVFREDYEIWGLADLIYDRGNPQPRIAAEILNAATVEKVRLGQGEVRGMRVIIFMEKDFNHVLVASMPTRASCLHLLDGASPEVPRGASPLIELIAPFSHIEQVQTHGSPTPPPEGIFGAEPEHGWCYYYQMAGLARQRGAWDEVARLGDEAMAAGLRPSDRTEWLPFLMGYIVVGNQEAAELVARMIRDEEPVRHRLCDAVDRAAFPNRGSAAAFEQLLCEFN